MSLEDRRDLDMPSTLAVVVSLTFFLLGAGLALTALVVTLKALWG